MGFQLGISQVIRRTQNTAICPPPESSMPEEEEEDKMGGSANENSGGRFWPQGQFTIGSKGRVGCSVPGGVIEVVNGG